MEQQILNEEEKKMIEHSLNSQGSMSTSSKQLPSKIPKDNSTDMYMKFCKPIAMAVLVVSILLLIYVLYTGVRRYRDSKMNAGVMTYNTQVGIPPPRPAIPQGMSGGKRSKKIMKNIAKGAKKMMRKMKGGNQCAGQCGCAATPPPR